MAHSPLLSTGLIHRSTFVEYPLDRKGLVRSANGDEYPRLTVTQTGSQDRPRRARLHNRQQYDPVPIRRSKPSVPLSSLTRLDPRSHRYTVDSFPFVCLTL